MRKFKRWLWKHTLRSKNEKTSDDILLKEWNVFLWISELETKWSTGRKIPAKFSKDENLENGWRWRWLLWRAPWWLSILLPPFFRKVRASYQDRWTLWIRKNFLIRVSGQEHLCNGLCHTRHILRNVSRWAQGNKWSFTGNPSAVAKHLSPHMAVLRRHFSWICSLSAVWFSKALGEANLTFLLPSVKPLLGHSLWKNRSRPIGVRICPAAKFNFFSTAFDPRKWTLVVCWKESLGRQPKLIAPENEGGDNTNYSSPPNVTFFDDPEVPFGPQGPQPRAPPEPHQPSGQPGPPGIPPCLPAAPSPAGDRERVETGYTMRERLHLHPRPSRLSLNLPKYQWVMAQMMMIRHHRERGKYNGLDRVIEYILTYQCHRNHKFNQWLLQDQMMRYQMRILRLMIPYHHQLDHYHQLNRGIAPEEPKDLDHVSEFFHVHPRMLANNNSLFLPPPPGIQQNLASQSEDENSATVVGPQNRWVIIQSHCKFKKMHGERGSTNIEGKEKYCITSAEYNANGKEV